MVRKRHFSQKQAFRGAGTTIFEKNKRAAPAEQAFLSKTSERHPTNEHFHQKQASGTRRTSIFIKNKRAATAEQRFLKINTQNAMGIRAAD